MILFSFADLGISVMFGYKYLPAVLTMKIFIFASFFSVMTSVNNSILSASGSAKEIAKVMAVAAAEAALALAVVILLHKHKSKLDTNIFSLLKG
jgi:O-antigen/teichoic acid export membrane protein